MYICINMLIYTYICMCVKMYIDTSKRRLFIQSCIKQPEELATSNHSKQLDLPFVKNGNIKGRE